MNQTLPAEKRSTDYPTQVFLSFIGGISVTLAFSLAIYFTGTREYQIGKKAGQQLARPVGAFVKNVDLDKYKDLIVTLENGNTITLYGQKNGDYLSAYILRSKIYDEMYKKINGLEKKLQETSEMTRKQVERTRQEYQTKMEAYVVK